jgi:aminopeptidase YwaD
MTSRRLTERADRHLQRLCLETQNRRVGSAGNRAATAFFAETVASLGFETECPEFDCTDWSHDGARVRVGGESFEAFPSPYSLGCQVEAPLAVASTVEELETLGAANGAANRILLIRCDLAKEQLMPKSFPFYNPDSHKRIVHLLETKQPRAIIAATSRNPELAGGLYPFPLIEDGDFDIPSAYMTEQVGNRLAVHEGTVISLNIAANRIPSKGCNVIARKGAGRGRRVVVCAHIDAKIGTPGAIDNASGVVVLLLLAELMKEYSGDLGVDLVALNGEDYYSAPGQVQYLRSNADRLGEIVLGINVDVAGYCEGNTAYSLYGCPAEVDGAVRRAFASRKDSVEGEPWYQSDHSLFIQNHVPALAITSDRFMELSTYVTHTPKDTPEIVDSTRLADVALALRDLLLDLDRRVAYTDAVS